MRRNLLPEGAKPLVYEIREIVKKAQQFQSLGVNISWENIGDPIHKGTMVPKWMRDIIAVLTQNSLSYGYCHSKGVLDTRKFLAARTNELKGVQITAEDILFFNGLGDAINKAYQYLDPKARIIAPTPGYSTHLSAEEAHAKLPPITYRLDPEKNWAPDLGELRTNIIANPDIVGILYINPDNPTGALYPESALKEFVSLAREFGLFIIADEIYWQVTYNGAEATPLASLIGKDVCGIAMRGISKEFPWPGSRCGWMEFYNREHDPEFARLVKTIEDAKMLEVCATTLPQLSIPLVMSHPEYRSHRKALNDAIARRGEVVLETLRDIPGLIVNKTYGAFYDSIIFRQGTLKSHQTLKVENAAARNLVENLVTGVPLDKRFVYYVLAATGICVVPISSFGSELMGFRVTLLEEDPSKLLWIYQRLKSAILEYLAS